MNVLKRTGLFEKIYRSLNKYSMLTSSSISRVRSRKHNESLVQTKLLNFMEQAKDKNEKNNELFEFSKFNSKIANEISSVVEKKNSCRKNTSEYDLLVASIRSFLRAEKKSKAQNAFRLVDDECCKRLGRLSKLEIFKMLHLLWRTGLNITQMKMYGSSLLALRKHLEKGRLCKNEMLQLLLFMSISKKLAAVNMKYLLNYLPPLHDLSLMEKSIVAHSTVKCGFKLKSEDVKLLEETLEANAAELVRVPEILVMICKALRFAGPSDDFFPTNLSREIVRSDKILTIMNAAHILCLYACGNYENTSVTNKLFKDSMRSLSQERVTLSLRRNPVRIKDVNMLLWASSTLNYKLGESDRREICLFVYRRYKKFENYSSFLVATLLSLWILDCKLLEIVDKCLKNGIFKLVNEQEDLWKPPARLHLLLNCIKIESPQTKLPKEFFETREVAMKVGKSVKRLHQIINNLKKNLNIREATIDCPIGGMYIAGVSIRSEKKLIHVDLLNETTCFKGTNVPHGLANLKLRLLAKIGYHSVLITEEQSNDVKFVSSTIVKCIENVGDAPNSKKRLSSKVEKRKKKS